MAQQRKNLKIEGSNLWYLVGLIASDGCLSSDGRHIDITAKDKSFLEQLKHRLDFKNKVTIKNKNTTNKAFHIQLSNVNFYEFLLSVGLTPNKSLTLRSLNIPPEFFSDFLRGLIDGDGSIRFWKHPTNQKEQWSLRIYSGSQPFITWLQSRVEERLGSRGRIHSEIKPLSKNPLYTLKYGKMAARKIFKKCYSPTAFGLGRKKDLALRCLQASCGWSKSKTVFN
jgi:hypothetical protein